MEIKYSVVNINIFKEEIINIKFLLKIYFNPRIHKNIRKKERKEANKERKREKGRRKKKGEERRR